MKKDKGYIKKDKVRLEWVRIDKVRWREIRVKKKDKGRLEWVRIDKSRWREISVNEEI